MPQAFGGEVEKGGADRLLQLVGSVADQENIGDMGLVDLRPENRWRFDHLCHDGPAVEQPPGPNGPCEAGRTALHASARGADVTAMIEPDPAHADGSEAKTAGGVSMIPCASGASTGRRLDDLHDEVIQTLFGVGLTLQAAAVTSGEEGLAGRLEEAAQNLASAVRDLREYAKTNDDGGSGRRRLGERRSSPCAAAC